MESIGAVTIETESQLLMLFMNILKIKTNGIMRNSIRSPVLKILVK